MTGVSNEQPTLPSIQSILNDLDRDQDERYDLYLREKRREGVMNVGHTIHVYRDRVQSPDETTTHAIHVLCCFF
jgi:hypothetical protein